MQLQRAASSWLLVPLMFGLLAMPHSGHDGPTVGGQIADRHFVGITQAMAHEPASAMNHEEPAGPRSGATAAVASPSNPATPPTHVAFALSCLVVLLVGLGYLALRWGAWLTIRRSPTPPASRSATRPAGRDPPHRLPTLLFVLRT